MTPKKFVIIFSIGFVPAIIMLLLLYYFQRPLLKVIDSYAMYMRAIAITIILLYSTLATIVFELNLKGKLLVFSFCLLYFCLMAVIMWVLERNEIIQANSERLPISLFLFLISTTVLFGFLIELMTCKVLRSV